MKKNEIPLYPFMNPGQKISLAPRHFVFLLFFLLLSLGSICPVHAVDSAGDVVITTNLVLGQNGDYPFAGIYVFDNLTIGDNVEITTTGISQLVIKVNNRLTLGRNAVIRVRNGYYPEAPVNLISSLNATNLQAEGALTPEGVYVYENMFGRGGDGGSYDRHGGGGGGGFGGGFGGAGGSSEVNELSSYGADNGGDGGTYIDDTGGKGGGATDLGSSALSTGRAGGGGNSGAGGDSVGSGPSFGGHGGGYGGGMLSIITNSILIIDQQNLPKLITSGQKGSYHKYTNVNVDGDDGQGGLLIIQNAGWNYPDGRSAKAARQNLWNLDAGTYGTHTVPSTNGGHGIVTGNPQKVFVNGMEIPYVEVTGISLDKTELNLTAGGDPGTLIETITPADATVKEVIWSIDKPEVASITTVDGIAYKIIEPLSNGTATITVTSVDGAFSASAIVYVGTVAKLSFSVTGGSYDGSQTVTITSSTAGASIRYTMDGTDPSSTVGTLLANGGSVTVSSTQTLKAIAYMSGLQDSEIASATYTISGSLKVNIGPSGLVPDARWRVDGGAWQTTGTTVVGLTAGNHIVDFLDITGGWYSPASKTVLITSGALTTATGTYSQTPPSGSLKVTITPAEAVAAGAQWRADGGEWQNSGATVTGLSIAPKTVEFKAISYWTQPANSTVSIIRDEIVETTGVYIAHDTTPAPFTFTDRTDVALNAVITSNTITVAGIDTAPISITGGTYSINGGAYTSAAGTVANGNTITVQLTSSGSFSTTKNATLTIGGLSDTFSVTTVAMDTTPNPFIFTDRTGIALNTVVTSNSIILSGINAPTPISITGGEYSVSNIAGLIWSAYSTTTPATVSPNNWVRVRQTSSGEYSTTTNATLTIGGVSDTFSVTTIDDTTPDTFAFTDQTGVALSTVSTSNVITVSGITAPVSISIIGGEYSVSTNGGSTWGSWTNMGGTVALNNQVKVRQTSSGSYSTTTNATLTIGGVSDTFSMTTIDDTTPDTFAFTDQTGVTLSTGTTSNVITVSGITAPVSISIIGGEYSVSTDGGSTWGSWTNMGGTVAPNNQVKVRQSSSGSYSTTTNATLTIGGVSDTFSVTTIDDTTPDAFTFTDQTGVSLNTVLTSNIITVSGINVATPISITGGEYCISTNGGSTWGSWTNIGGTVALNNQVKVRQTSSGSYSTTTNTTLTIGGVSDTFSVTTIDDTTPDAFTFTDQTGVSLNTSIESNTVTVSGITAPVSISITGGEYSISTNGGSTWGSWTNMGGTVGLNNQVKVRQASSISPSVTTDATLIIGGVSDTFSVTTKSESALGTITVDPNPDSINAPWTLTGPNAFSHSFYSDAVEGYLDPGEYTVTWGAVAGWDTPSSSTQTLAAGESITITGTYNFIISTPPTNDAQGSNITINGSNFGATQGGGYVDFNGVQGTIVSWTDTQIVVTVPYGATTGCMTVVTDYGTSGCMDFTVENPACYPPAKLSNYDYFDVVQDAYANVTDGNAVLLRTGTFIENVLLNRNIGIILQGGYNCPYDTNTGYTTIDGSLTIKDGTVTVEKLIIK